MWKSKLLVDQKAPLVCEAFSCILCLGETSRKVSKFVAPKKSIHPAFVPVLVIFGFVQWPMVWWLSLSTTPWIQVGHPHNGLLVSLSNRANKPGVLFVSFSGGKDTKQKTTINICFFGEFVTKLWAFFVVIMVMQILVKTWCFSEACCYQILLFSHKWWVWFVWFQGTKIWKNTNLGWKNVASDCSCSGIRSMDCQSRKFI